MTDNAKTNAKPESQRQAEWIRRHPVADDATPDAAARQGVSRGALPNGNPWKPETEPQPGSDHVPAPPVIAPQVITTIGNTLPADFGYRATLPDSRIVEAPPPSPIPVTIERVITVADERLAQEIGARLSQSKAFDDHPIGLRVHDGQVELDGSVAAEADKFEAEHLTSSVHGVVHIVNHLRVDPQPKANS